MRRIRTPRFTLLLDFEKQFPDSKMMPTIYSTLMDIYAAKKDTPKVNEFGEKAIKADPENVDALMAVSRSYAMSKTNLDKAVMYAQRCGLRCEEEEGISARRLYGRSVDCVSGQSG